MAIEVTSVSKRPERLSETASAIQVITHEDIRRSGATSLPEALRLAPNLQVAQVNASQWAVSARGFNNVLANKLLVLIDGRTVYTPLYAGVSWDVQNPPLETIDRIEVISGPGGTLWGANAVNGVINVITRSADETQGLYIEGGAGTELTAFGDVRYGGQLSSNVHARGYVEAFGRGSTALADGTDVEDDWELQQGGFRLDAMPSAKSQLTWQFDIYNSRPNPDGDTPVVAQGGNTLARWSRAISERSDFRLQVYYDRAYRDFQNGFTEDLATYDVDWQHRFPLGNRQELIWGVGIRLMDHETENLPNFEFLPSHKTLQLYSAFIQDAIILAPDRWRLTLGSKFEHNSYTGLEVQPSGRLAWTPNRQHTVWAAVSRAVRTPSRIDRDFVLSIAPGVPFFAGGDFESEEVLAFELGWRVQPNSRMQLSLATFYNEYDDLRSAEPGPPPLGIPITIQNGVQGHTYGAEVAAIYQVTDRWRLRGGYTFLRKDLSLKPGSNDLNNASAESNDPEHQLLIQSTADLPGRLEWDAVLRFVDELPDPELSSYFGLDLRLAWHATRRLELSIVGQNLLQDRHAEFIPASAPPREIERSVYGKITWR